MTSPKRPHKPPIRSRRLAKHLPADTVPTLCTCKAFPAQWEDVVDSATGTSYARCRACGRHWVSSRRGYVDWHLGLMVEAGYVVGSMWTQSVSSTFFGKGWPSHES
jgi:hypothetical protein